MRKNQSIAQTAPKLTVRKKRVNSGELTPLFCHIGECLNLMDYMVMLTEKKTPLTHTFSFVHNSGEITIRVRGFKKGGQA